MPNSKNESDDEGGAPDPLDEQIRETESQLENTYRMLERFHEAESHARDYVRQLRADLERRLERLARRRGSATGTDQQDSPPTGDTGDGTCMYEIDAADAIVRCNGEWDRFAGENAAGPEVMKENVRGRLLWDFISDPTARTLYRRVVKVARGGLTVAFPLRCDAPAARRNYRMSVGPWGAPGFVRFCMEPVSVAERSACPPAPANRDRTGVKLTSCSWCNKVRVGEDWLEIEDAAEPLRLVGSRDGHWLSHTTCDPCRWRVTEALIRAY